MEVNQQILIIAVIAERNFRTPNPSSTNTRKEEKRMKMNIEHLTTEEVLALADNRFDIIINDAHRQGNTLTLSNDVEPTYQHSEAYLRSKLGAIDGIRVLLGEYEKRVCRALAQKKAIGSGDKK
jgi:hypothetical protein